MISKIQPSLQTKLMELNRERTRVQDAMMELINAAPTNGPARRADIDTWNDLQSQMFRLNEQISLARQRMEQNEQDDN